MATSLFSNGYALIIAVNDNRNPAYALPAVGRDVDRLGLAAAQIGAGDDPAVGAEAEAAASGFASSL